MLHLQLWPFPLKFFCLLDLAVQVLEKHPTRHVFQIQPLALHFSPRPYIQHSPVSQQRDRVQLFRYHALLLSCLLTPTFTVSCPHFSCMHYAFRLSSAMPGICLPCSLDLLGPLASFLQLLPGPVSYAFILFLAFGHRARPTTVLSSVLAFLCPQTLHTQDTHRHCHLFPPNLFCSTASSFSRPLLSVSSPRILPWSLPKTSCRLSTSHVWLSLA